MNKRSVSRTAGASIVALIVLLVSLYVRDIAAAFGIKISGFPFAYGGSILDNLLAVLLVVGAAILLNRARQLSLRTALGLRWNGFKGPVLTLLATVPCWIGVSMQGRLIETVNVIEILLLAMLFPLAEELAFRGFGFIFFHRVLGWRLVIAALVQAIVFGMVHWWGAVGKQHQLHDNFNHF